MSRNDETAGNEFDTWMGAGPSVKASPDVEAVADEAPADGAKSKGKAATALSKLARKPLVLVPTILGVAVIGLMVVRGGGGEPSPAETQYAAIATMPQETMPEAAADTEPNPYGQPGQQPEQGVVPVDATATGDPEDGLALAGGPAPDAEPEAQQAPAPEAASEPAAEPAVAVEADSERSRHELELRIAALENDLDRAQQTRHANLRVIRDLRAQLAKHEGQGSYSVVAVLNDGVVVRDTSGSERVYGLGARIGE